MRSPWWIARYCPGRIAVCRRRSIEYTRPQDPLLFYQSMLSANIDDTRTLPCCQLHDRAFFRGKTRSKQKLCATRRNNYCSRVTFKDLAEYWDTTGSNDSAWTCPKYDSGPGFLPLVVARLSLLVVYDDVLEPVARSCSNSRLFAGLMDKLV